MRRTLSHSLAFSLGRYQLKLDASSVRHTQMPLSQPGDTGPPRYSSEDIDRSIWRCRRGLDVVSIRSVTAEAGVRRTDSQGSDAWGQRWNGCDRGGHRHDGRDRTGTAPPGQTEDSTGDSRVVDRGTPGIIRWGPRAHVVHYDLAGWLH